MVDAPQKVGNLRRVGIISDRTPAAIARLKERLHREVPALVVSSIVRIAGDERGAAGTTRASRAGAILLRFLHACRRPIVQANLDEAALSEVCEREGIPLFTARNAKGAEISAFLKLHGAELIVVYGGLGPSELKGICGSQAAVIAAAATFSPLSTSAQVIDLHVAWHEPATRPRIAARQTLATEPYDTATSLRLKIDLIARDLLIQAGAELVSGRPPSNMAEVAECGQSQTLPRRIQYQRSMNFPVWRQRAVWKLLLRTLVFGPFIVVRNWYRRITRRFPVVILYHHLVSDRPHRMGIPTEEFLRHVRFLKCHYRLVSLPAALEKLRSGRMDSPTVVLTFDDGYRENFVNLRAVTEEENVSATLFICTNHVETGHEFDHDVRRGERGFLPMDWSQVRTAAASGSVPGSHTRSHFDCGATDPNLLVPEIEGSREDLENKLHRQIVLFSFPWGNPANMSQPAAEIARRSYRHVFSGCGGVNFPRRGGDFWHLKRRCHTNDLWELELAIQGVL
ncbi:MAG: polysaccharide deacetylase family protein, partial [Candidatus Acidiferrales bacterium]